MKNLYLRTSVALACAFGLAGCGSDDANLLLRVGQIVSLTQDGMTLSYNGGPELAVPANATAFNFPNLIPSDSDFEIKIVKQPPNAFCTIYNGKGKTGAYSPNSIYIDCVLKLYDLEGSVSGLTADSGVVINNGSHKITIPKGATKFSLTVTDPVTKVVTGKIPSGVPYGLTVLTPPAAGSCVIQNGTGVMPAADLLLEPKVVVPPAEAVPFQLSTIKVVCS